MAVEDSNDQSIQGKRFVMSPFLKRLLEGIREAEAKLEAKKKRESEDNKTEEHTDDREV